jgi:Xaa-Pro aminopeptidase
MKAVKNATEQEGFRQCHVRDGSALARYFAWLEEQLNNGIELNESQGADQLEKFRSWVSLPSTNVLLRTSEYRELDLFKGLSFTTISSTGPNGGKNCIIHVLSNCN